MNVFEHLSEYGNCDRFEPSKPASDEPTPNFDYLNEDERNKRVFQLRGRLERGEELWHDDEKKVFQISGGAQTTALFDTPRGMSQFRVTYRATSKTEGHELPRNAPGIKQHKNNKHGRPAEGDAA